MTADHTRISPAGMSFLKCAFAPPDFAQSKTDGVPDKYCGTTLVKKHRAVATVAIAATTDYYFLLAPVPGSAYYTLSKAAGVAPQFGDVWVRTEYNDAATLFGATPALANTIVSRFRYVSQHIEVIPTVNEMTWSGSIQAWKIPVQVTEKNLAGVLYFTTIGLESTSAVSAARADQFSGPFNGGFFGGAFSAAAEFEFHSTTGGLAQVPAVITAGTDFGALGTATNTPGFDNSFETLVVKISGVGATAQSLMLKTWACVEYQVYPNSGLYEYMTMSSYDPDALIMYRKIIAELPVGVPYAMNDTFWQRVMGIIRRLSKAVSYVPGPVGMIAGGVNAITDGISSL